MTPDKWAQIVELFDAALVLADKDRTAFLEEKCAHDRDMQGEVKRLINHHEKGTDFLSEPLVSTSSLSVGDVIANRYRIVTLIGRGGMGEVYQAEDKFLRETVAIKKLRPDVARDDVVVRQFQKEIQLARKVTHANVCRVFEVGFHEPKDSKSRIFFFTMELLNGETLTSRLRREGKLSREVAFPIALQMAEGLNAAHSAGVIHTDFKSGNVMLVPLALGGERAVITDFGLARRDPSMIPADVTHSLMEGGRVEGTVAYMSPEQLEGGEITPASDIYSFGVVLFEMATGQKPFDDRRIIHSAMQRANPDSISVRSLVPDIDPRWERAIVRCLQRDPERRFGSAAELADCFREGVWWMPQLWTRREWIRASATAAGLLVAGGGGYIWFTRPYQPVPEALTLYRKGLEAMRSMTYEAARKHLERAVAVDPNFALSHAALARAYQEMDYSDRAMDSMLRAVTIAQESRLSSADDRRLKAAQYMVGRDYDRAAPLFQQLEDEAEGQEKAAAALESGWLAQLRDETASAQAGYERAVSLAPSFAAAKLRLGFILGRAGQTDLALAAFAEAENLYGDSSDSEGIIETLWQRANQLNRRRRSSEAMPVITKALGVARTLGNRYQEIRLMLLQGVAFRNLGQGERATQLAQEAIDAADKENMENLAASGLIDLGNALLEGGDPLAAEPYFQRALTVARRGKVRRAEARAKGSLVSVFEQDRRPEDAKQFALDAMQFYQQAGYKREMDQVKLMLAGIYEQLGDYKEGIRTAREAVAGLSELKDRVNEGLARERLGRNLVGLGSWPEALEEYQRASAMFESDAKGGKARLTVAQLMWRLGDKQGAVKMTQDVEKILERDRNPQVLSLVFARNSEFAYDEARWNDVLGLATQGLSAEDRDDEAERDLSLFQALVWIRNGDAARGADSVAKLIGNLEQDKLFGNAASVRLTLAQAWLAVGKRSNVLQLASHALEFFEPRNCIESVWRGHALAGIASEDAGQTEAHKTKGRAALSQLKGLWPAASFDGYLARPALRQLSSGIGF